VEFTSTSQEEILKGCKTQSVFLFLSNKLNKSLFSYQYCN